MTVELVGALQALADYVAMLALGKGAGASTLALQGTLQALADDVALALRGPLPALAGDATTLALGKPEMRTQRRSRS